MPFIDLKTTVPVTDYKREKLRTRFGGTMSTLGKPAEFLMVDISDSQDLSFGGQRMTPGAYLGLSLFGDASPEVFRKMTVELTTILKEELDIPPDSIYITYTPVYNWGWNNKNF